MIVVDDHTLLAVLAGNVDEDVRRLIPTGEVFTTGSWYYRLARAVHDPGSGGSLSRQFISLPDEVRSGVLGALEELPYEIGLLSPRVLVPVMASLSGVGRFNHLNAEAIAACLVLPARLRVVAAAPMLRTACERLGIGLDVLP